MSERESAWGDIGGSSGKDPIERGKFSENARQLDELLKKSDQEDDIESDELDTVAPEASQSIEESRRQIHEILDQIKSEDS